MISDIKQYKQAKTAQESFDFWKEQTRSKFLGNSINRKNIKVRFI